MYRKIVLGILILSVTNVSYSEGDSQFVFDIGMQTNWYKYGLSKRFDSGASSDLNANYLPVTTLLFRGSYWNGSHAYYAQAKLLDPTTESKFTLELPKYYFSKKSNSNIQLGYFFLSRNGFNWTLGSEVNSSKMKIFLKKDVTYNGEVLKKGSHKKLNISNVIVKAGVSNSGEKKGRPSSISAGLKQDFLTFPFYSSSSKKISDARYSGQGTYFKYFIGNKKIKKLNLKGIGISHEVSYGKLKRANLKTVKALKSNLEIEDRFYLSKNWTVSFISGYTSLAKTNETSKNIGIASAVIATGTAGYLYFNENTSGIKLNISDNLYESTVVIGGTALVMSKIGKLIDSGYDYKDKSYLNNIYNGVKFNYRF